MTVALQWHLQSNRSEAIALSTQRSTRDAEEGRNDVMIVLCDARQDGVDNPALAASTAQSLYDTLTYATQNTDPAQRMSRSVGQIMQQFKRSIVPSRGSGSNITDVRILAAMLTENRLTIGRSHGGSVYLLRDGQLQHLTEDFTNDAECDIGQVDLEGEDRILFCSDAIGEGLTISYIRNILRSQPSARKALQLVFRETSAEQLPLSASAAVLDYISGESGSFAANVMTGVADSDAAEPLAQRTLRSVPALLAIGAVALAALLLIPWLFGSRDPQPAVAGQQLPTTTLNTPAPAASPTVILIVQPETAVPVIAPTETLVPVIAPIEPAAPDASPTPAPTATNPPPASPTVVPATETAIPATETPLPLPTPLPRPTRRPPTLIPLATETPVPPPTAEIILPTATQPPSDGGGGGGGGGGGEQPPCLPGAQCGP
jgi:hypothetical protein